ncbi:MAG: DUF1232 domain-containing protein [Melioribacteraceae bacterium]|nr:DUF1232 domain-containing protein [Melioribacteraceae bacterium]MCF8265363.1 DUF1232 domain-containing protein [Melioribacteraceae bacterium]MCF8412143.1 DUF1232 domain-containing protein [Melioribacteraceae bacterium]
MEERKKEYIEKLKSHIGSWLERNPQNDYKWKEYIVAAPDLFELLCKLEEEDIPAETKVGIETAINYFISPFDIIPEAVIGPLGYIDDVSVAANALKNTFPQVSKETVLSHWKGEADIFDLIERITGDISEMIDASIWEHITKRLVNYQTP